MARMDTEWGMRDVLCSVWAVIKLPSMRRVFSVRGLEDKTLPWHVLSGAEENIFEAEPVQEL